MRRTVGVIVILFVICFARSTAQSSREPKQAGTAATNMAVVDLQRLANESKEGKAAFAQMEAARIRGAGQAELQKLANDLQKNFAEKLEPIIRDAAAEQGLTLVVGRGDLSVLWSQSTFDLNALDVTTNILRRLDAATPAAPPRPVASSATVSEPARSTPSADADLVARISSSQLLKEVTFPSASGEAVLSGDGNFTPVVQRKLASTGNTFLNLVVDVSNRGIAFSLVRSEVALLGQGRTYTALSWFEDLGLVARRGETLSISGNIKLNLIFEVPEQEIKALRLQLGARSLGTLEAIGMK